MKVLVACEESQVVCSAFRAKGHEAYSCDLQPCSGGHPEWHIMHDVLPLLNGDCEFFCLDGQRHVIFGKWDLIIAHPPCTYLTFAANQCHSLKVYSLDYINSRTLKRLDGMAFFLSCINANCDRVAVENPTGVMNTCYRRPDQTIQPWFFARDEYDSSNYFNKRTHLWLKGLSKLSYDISSITPYVNSDFWNNGKRKNWTESNHGSINRSKTFPGIAAAMADQWG